MRRLNKLAMLMLTLVVSFALTTTVLAASTSWNFKDSNFKSLGTISSTVTVDNLKLVATSSKTMQVKADSQTLDGTSYTYCLATGGSGTTSYRSVNIPVTKNTQNTIKVTLKSSGSSARTVAIADPDGNVLGNITAGTSISTQSFTYSGNRSNLYIYSTNSNVNIYKIQVDAADSGSSDNSSSDNGSTGDSSSDSGSTGGSDSSTDTSSNSVTVTSFSDLVSAVDKMAKTSGGGTVYVNTKTIKATAQLALSSTKGNPVAIVGVKQSDGTYPVIDFSSFRDSTVGSTGKSLSKSSDSHVGIRITGTNYTIKNLIIQKAPDNGIQIKGSSAGKNTVENCIVRYNNDAGIQITDGAYSNTMKYVYSYRNCDVYTLGGNSDGFAPKLGTGKGNTFYGCYAWDNSDDGWDSYDKSGQTTPDLTYEECATWNNGNPDVFTGKYDYENGNSLDTNLFLVELICKQDSSFASNYKSGKFSLPTASFINTEDGVLTLSKWTGSNYGGNPNGFKFGSAYTPSSCVRTVKNCLSFNHASKGFDNNNSACTGSFTNCISFDNGYNYHLPAYKFTKWSNIYGFNGSSKDKLTSGYSASTPSSSTQSSIRSKVDSTVDSIVSKCNNNVIPGAVKFDIY